MRLKNKIEPEAKLRRTQQHRDLYVVPSICIIYRVAWSKFKSLALAYLPTAMTKCSILRIEPNEIRYSF